MDEVHAADVYMRQFLVEALRWLGQAGAPVVLLSATLPPAQRHRHELGPGPHAHRRRASRAAPGGRISR
ncbi:hypothetical protein [Streptomyces albidocamelliae]|uniref:Uncharacterized protein n=1 Tax=Streptomyces albidocamelliae TaxID=2981135 RepID=A0ABY6F1G2_9ACTN|nr:hypothetical protein [Streptomyces sp. HUAS 14-6]UXY40498.1 hypothetical protein N8I86_38710 [Streptomyces sp. HUAS 14-6]